MKCSRGNKKLTRKGQASYLFKVSISTSKHLWWYHTNHKLINVGFGTIGTAHGCWKDCKILSDLFKVCTSLQNASDRGYSGLTLSHESWKGVNHYEQTTSRGNRILPDIYLLSVNGSISEYFWVFSNANLYMFVGKQTIKQINAGAGKSSLGI